MGVLHDGTNYLIEKYASSVVTPASLGRLREPPRTNWIGAGFGVSKALGGLEPLPATIAELRGIIKEPGNQDGLIPGRIFLDEHFTWPTMLDVLRTNQPP